MAAMISHLIYRVWIMLLLRVPIEQILDSFSANLIIQHFFTVFLIVHLITLVYGVICKIKPFWHHGHLILDLVQYLFLLCLKIYQHLLTHFRVITEVVSNISFLHWSSAWFNQWSIVLSSLYLFKNFIFINKTEIGFSSRWCFRFR